MKIKSFQATDHGVYAMTEDGELYFRSNHGLSCEWINIGQGIGKPSTKKKIPINMDDRNRVRAPLSEMG